MRASYASAALCTALGKVAFEIALKPISKLVGTALTLGVALDRLPDGRCNEVVPLLPDQGWVPGRLGPALPQTFWKSHAHRPLPGHIHQCNALSSILSCSPAGHTCHTRARGKSSQARRKQDFHASKQLKDAISSCNNLSDWCRAVEALLLAPTSYHIAPAWTRLARVVPEDEPLPPDVLPLVQRLAAATSEQLRSFDPRQLANITYVLGKLQLQPENGLLLQLIQRLVANEGRMLQQDTPQGLSNVAWALARLGALTEVQAHVHIARTAMGKLSGIEAKDFTPQALSNLMYAFALAGVKDTGFMTVVAAAALPRLRDFSPQGLSNVVWAHANLDIHNAAFLAAVADAALPLLREFKAQQLDNMAWAFAKAGQQHPVLFDGIFAAAVPKLDTMEPRTLAMLAWAAAIAQHQWPVNMCNAWLCAAMQKLHAFNAQNLAIALWSVSQMDVKITDALRHFSESWMKAAASKAHTFDSQNVSNSLLALQRLKCYDQGVVHALVQRAYALLPDFGEQELSNTATALAGLRHLDVEFMEALAHEVSRRWSEFARMSDIALAFGMLQHHSLPWQQALVDYVLQADLMHLEDNSLSIFLWAFAALDLHSHPQAVTRLMQCLANRGTTALTPAGCRRVWQTWHWLQTSDGSVADNLPSNSAVLQLVQACGKHVAAENTRHIAASPSDLQLQVSKVLRGLGVGKVLLEQQMEPTLQVVDIVVLRPDGSILAVVEVDGPHHFTANKPHRPTGSTVLRDKLHQGQGLPVLKVPYNEWGLLKSAQLQREYLRKGLLRVAS